MKEQTKKAEEASKALAKTVAAKVGPVLLAHQATLALEGYGALALDMRKWGGKLTEVLGGWHEKSVNGQITPLAIDELPKMKDPIFSFSIWTQNIAKTGGFSVFCSQQRKSARAPVFVSVSVFSGLPLLGHPSECSIVRFCLHERPSAS